MLLTDMPRLCGIATFTTDICEAVAAEHPKCECIVGAVNGHPEGYDYSSRIRSEIDEKEVGSYRRAADFLNITNVEVVSAQHEFGICGGSAGSHLLALLRDVHMPVVTTLHTLLPEPDEPQRFVMDQLIHGVGPMRKYCIGAILLDLHDPATIIGQLSR